jgi:hypothetical protein
MFCRNEGYAIKPVSFLHSSSQPRKSSNDLLAVSDKSGGKDSESFSAHDHCPQSWQIIVNNPSFLQRYVEVNDMPSNQFSPHASHQSSLGSLIRSPDTHPSDQNDNSRNGRLCNEGSMHSMSQAYKGEKILSSHDSNGSVEDLSSQGYPSVSEHTESNPSTIIVSDEETKSYQSIFSGLQRSSGRQEINKVAKCSSSSISKQSSMRKIDNDDFSTSKSQSNINQLKSLSSLKSSSVVVAQEPLPSKDNSQLPSRGKESLVNPHMVTSKNCPANNHMKVSSSKDNPQGSTYFSQSSNVLSPHLSPHYSNYGIDKPKSLSTSEHLSQSWHIQESVSIV